MTSIQPIDKTLPYSPGSECASIVSSAFRFRSGRVTPDPDNNVDDQSRVLSPTRMSFQVDTASARTSFSTRDVSPRRNRFSSIPNENSGERAVKISEYRTPESTPFQPIATKVSPKKLHDYVLLTSRTAYFLSGVAILSLAIVLIGLGLAISSRQSELNFRCTSISYCPRNSSYSISCNTTNGYCQCYDTERTLIGCLQQRNYGQGCYRSQECSTQENLQCNLSLYQCECLDHYWYNGSSCVPMLTYGATCSIFNDTCDRSLNLTCLTGNICTCDTNVTFWNGQYCELYRSLNDPCDPYQNVSGCSMAFTCDNSTTTCQCLPSSYFDGEVCLSYSSYLEPCYDSTSCLPNTQLICSWGLCLCDDLYYYWSPSALTCVYPKQIQYNATCSYQTSCESDFGLRCINGQCVCEFNSYWTPGNYCDIQSQYNEQCLTAPCLGNTGLICSSNICTCPQYYYWDNYVCQYQRTYTAFCLSDNWCRLDLGLRCRSLSCTCSLCPTCFWDGVRCRDCPTSWQVVVSNGTIQPRVYCYLKVNLYVNWNESLPNCTGAATSYFGSISHLIYIDDLQELQDAAKFTTTAYYDIFIGHTNRFNYSQWFLGNGTISPPMNWCTGVATTFSNLTCARILVSSVCITNIVCYGWTSRYICELD